MTLEILLIIGFTLPGVSGNGDRVFYSDAYSLGVGGVSAVLENFDNPAASGIMYRTTLKLSGNVFMGTEKRGLRVYDSYGNNMGIRSVASNNFEFADVGACGLLVPLGSFRAGVKYERLWDFNYTYMHEFRDDFYQLTRIEEDNYRGRIHAFDAFLGLKYKFFNFGIEGDLLFSNKEEEHKIIIPQVSDTITESANRSSGRRAKLGFLTNPGMHFRLGYSFTNRYEMRSGDNGDFTYPEAHTLAVLYQPPGRVPTKFVAEVVREAWDEPVHIYKFGIEHTLALKYALRYGFCVFPDNVEPAIWTTVLTLGFGMDAAQYYFDIGYGYARRSYANTDFGGLDITGKYLFDESIGHFVLSGGMHF